ncbi:outer membrane protein assembly factor BamD [Limnohabitans sp.]|uniref:outer membrane protein assembly factor BamD n=1 Tax=Limnohabitans sp. TaxID=1907725 RepID=UPI00286F9D91|nr:outer membrane protein assembly factor BamD [Limnohabitans sp.]
MLRLKLSTVWMALGLTITLLFTGCADSNYDPTKDWSIDKLYNEAKDEMTAGAYDKAIGMYEKLEGRAAGTLLAQQAQLDKAWAQYKTNEPVQAVATLDRFIKLNPASPALDYALYLKGLVNFNDNLGLFSSWTDQDLAERDPKQAKESFEAFRELLIRFPDSKYSVDARLRMAFIKNSLARSDVHVARFYYQRGAYVAAINRAQTTVQEYRDVPAVEEALFIMVQSYDKLGLNQLRDDTKRVLETSYPNTVFLYPERLAAKKSWWKFWQ